VVLRLLDLQALWALQISLRQEEICVLESPPVKPPVQYKCGEDEFIFNDKCYMVGKTGKQTWSSAHLSCLQVSVISHQNQMLLIIIWKMYKSLSLTASLEWKVVIDWLFMHYEIHSKNLFYNNCSTSHN